MTTPIHSEQHCLCGDRQGSLSGRHRNWCPSHPVQIERRLAGLPPSHPSRNGVKVPMASFQFRRDLRTCYPDSRTLRAPGLSLEDSGIAILEALKRLEESGLGSAISRIETATWGWPATEEQIRFASRTFGRTSVERYRGAEMAEEL